MMNEVFITRTAASLPLEPVGNDRMEAVLGCIAGKPSRARRLVLRSNGIQSRHYALDPLTGEPVMSNAQLAAEAIRALGATGYIDCLAAATSSADQLLPGHGVMVHGELGWPQLEVVSLAGVCLAGTAALRYAAMAVACGAERAVASASELVSPVLHARNFEPESEARLAKLEQHPEIAFEKDFLRWMLSDGAGALLLEQRPGQGVSLKVLWIELFSNAHRHPACMYAGAEKMDDGSLRGWKRFGPEERMQRSLFAVQQDVRLLNEHVAPVTILDPVRVLRERRGLRAEQIDWFLPHISSMYFAPILERTLDEARLPIPRDRWFTNLVTCGNTGSASPYIMLDGLLREAPLQSGQHILMYVPESGRFSSGFVLLEVV